MNDQTPKPEATPAPAVQVTPPPAIKPSFAETADITLNFPIAIGGVQTNRVTMRRPKVRDRLVVARQPGTEDEKETLLLGNLCGLAPNEFDEMDMSDYRQLQTALSGFLEPRSGS